MKHSDGFFEWSGRYRLFVNHLAEMLTNHEVINVPPFSMNKTRIYAMPEIINEYIKTGLI
jgi:hypothetical protein